MSYDNDAESYDNDMINHHSLAEVRTDVGWFRWPRKSEAKRWENFSPTQYN